MKYYRCDNCDKLNTGNAPVVLTGGILLPELYMEKHFCCRDCFWKWITKCNPLTNNTETKVNKK